MLLNRDGLHQFWTWLELVGNESGRSLLIAAHNGSGFDFPVLLVIIPLLSMLLLLLSLSTFSILLLFFALSSVMIFCMITGKHGQSWPLSALQSLWQSSGSRHLQSLQVKEKVPHPSSTSSLIRKLFAERGEPEQSCKLENLLQKFHPLWREKQVEKNTFL